MQYKRAFIIILLFLSLTSCKDKATSEEDKFLYINPTVYIAKSEESKKNKQILFLEEFFSKEWDASEFEGLLLNPRDILTGVYDIYWEIKDRTNFKPTLLSLEQVSETETIAKVGFMTPVEDGFSSLFAIYNFMIVETTKGLRLSNIFKYKTKDWQSISNDNNKYFAYPQYKFDKTNVDKMSAFNRELARFFETNPINFNYYVCKNLKEAMQLRGFDFEISMYYNESYGAFTFPRINTIFAGNDSEYYPHELVHLYTYRLFQDKHHIIDEGVAVYLGGAQGLSFEKHIQVLKEHLLKHNINIFNELFEAESSYALSDKVSLKHSIGALLCAIVEQELGKEQLFDLLNSGTSDEALFESLEELLGLSKENFDDFITHRLNLYF